MGKAKKERFKNEYSIINNRTGEELEYDEYKKMDYSINKEVQREALKTKLICPESDVLIRLNTDNERKWFKLFVISLTEKDINYDLYGFLMLLVRYMKTDGSCKVGDDSRKNFWAEKLNIPLPTFNRQFKKLENGNIVKHIRGKGIYMNPYFIRYGNNLKPNVLEIFKLKLDGDNKLVNSELTTDHQ